MSNYYTDQYNEFLNNAQDIYEYLSGNYMNQYEGGLLGLGTQEIAVGGMKIVELCKFRKMKNDQITFAAIKSAMKNALASYHCNSCAVGYFVVSNQSTIRLFFASEVEGCTGFDKALHSFVPEAVLKTNFVSRYELADMSKYGGVITGIFSVTKPILDEIIDEMKGSLSVLALIAKPFSRSESNQYEAALADLLSLSNSLISIDQGFGRGSRVNVRNSFPGNNLLNSFLVKQLERYGKYAEDFWKVSIWFGSNTKDKAARLAARVTGSLTSSDEAHIEKGRYFFTNENPLQSGRLSISKADYSNISLSLDSAVRKGSFYSIAATDELSGIFQLPTRGHRGIDVIDVNVGPDSMHVFSTNVPAAEGISFAVGKEAINGQVYRIAYNDLKEHMLITGATGSGKTNTVMAVIKSLYSENIPFCILESAKKEYWRLYNAVTDLKVLSAGDDALPLRLNPFEPEEGVIIGNHIDDLMYAFSGAFEMEEATRLSLDGLIKYTYEKMGWELGEISYKQAKRFPGISDVYNNLYEYSKKEILSGPEVKSNIEGSIIRRLLMLLKGTVGKITNTEHSITGQELCCGSILVELDDLSLEVKPFITNLLLVKMNQYLRQRGSSGSLNNVIILEEAHNVFAEISNNRQETSRDISSRYFSNLLSEIRGFGTGMLIVDQGASQINSNAVANTKIKILHSVAMEQDAKAEAFALHLNEYQITRLPELETGTALIAVRGESNVCKVNINRIDNGNVENFACLHCKHRRLCHISEVKEIIDNAGRKELLLSRIFKDRHSADAIKRYADEFFNTIALSDKYRNCAFGYMTANIPMSCVEREKRRIMFRYLY